jgi:glycosyltransferase involved in cell wall biosynthesis
MYNISVLMPVFNGQEYIAEAIDSILNQSCNNFELIIIDDGSSDNSKNIIESYKDNRIKYIRNNINQGAHAARNVGIKISQGKYIAIMDSDDISLPNRLEIQYNFMEDNPGFGLCGGQAISFGDGKTRKPMLAITDAFTHNDIALELMFRCPFVHPTIMLRKEILTKNNILYENTPIEDYQLYARLLSHTKFKNLQDTLIYYRRHKQQLTANYIDESKSIYLVQKNVLEAYNKLYKLNIDTTPYLPEKANFKLINKLSNQFKQIRMLFLANPQIKQHDFKLGKKYLRYCLKCKANKFMRLHAMIMYLPVDFKFYYFSYYLRNFLKK